MTKEETEETAVRWKGGRRLSTQELTVIGLMFDDPDYKMYLRPDNTIGFKKKEELLS